MAVQTLDVETVSVKPTRSAVEVTADYPIPFAQAPLDSWEMEQSHTTASAQAQSAFEAYLRERGWMTVMKVGTLSGPWNVDGACYEEPSDPMAAAPRVDRPNVDGVAGVEAGGTVKPFIVHRLDYINGREEFRCLASVEDAMDASSALETVTIPFGTAYSLYTYLGDVWVATGPAYAYAGGEPVLIDTTTPSA